MQEMLRHSTIRVTLDPHTQAVTIEKRKAQAPVVALLFPGKTQERSALTKRLPSSVPILCLFVPTGKWRNSDKPLKRNGGDDETRTRDLCRDSYKTAGTAKGRLSRSKSHETLHSVGWVVGWKISRSSLKMFPSFCFKSESVSSTAGGTANFPQWVGWVKRPIVEGR